MKLVFDIEADNFLQDCTTVWCSVFKDLETGEEFVFENPRGIASTDIGDSMSDLIGNAGLLVGHNIIGYDLEVLKKLYGINFTGRVVDTYVISTLLNPDRIGGHSLEAWGKRMKFEKDEWTDFSKFHPAMVDYCHQDVLVTEALYNYFMGGLDEWKGIELSKY